MIYASIFVILTIYASIINNKFCKSRWVHNEKKTKQYWHKRNTKYCRLEYVKKQIAFFFHNTKLVLFRISVTCCICPKQSVSSLLDVLEYHVICNECHTGFLLSRVAMLLTILKCTNRLWFCLHYTKSQSKMTQFDNKENNLLTCFPCKYTLQQLSHIFTWYTIICMSINPLFISHVSKSQLLLCYLD